MLFLLYMVYRLNTTAFSQPPQSRNRGMLNLLFTYQPRALEAGFTSTFQRKIGYQILVYLVFIFFINPLNKQVISASWAIQRVQKKRLRNQYAVGKISSRKP